MAYQYDPSMAPAFNARMQAMDAQGRGGQIAGAYAQAANNGFPVQAAQQAAPTYGGIQMAPAFRPPPMAAPQRGGVPNPLLGGGDPRAQTMRYMTGAARPQQGGFGAAYGGALSNNAPALHGGALSNNAPALHGGALSNNAPALQSFQRPPMAYASRPMMPAQATGQFNAQQAAGTPGAQEQGLARQLAATRGY